MTSAFDEPTLHHVAVAVFTTVSGVDFTDAAYAAEQGVRQALLSARLPGDGFIVPARFRGQRTAPVEIHVVREVGMSASGKLLNITVNQHAYPRIG